MMLMALALLPKFRTIFDAGEQLLQQQLIVSMTGKSQST